MKVSISYPPIPSSKGIPLLSQNRQFQYFNKPTYIYPVVPAYAATLLKENGFEVLWDDGIAEEKTYEKWLKDLVSEHPDIIAIETKTPVVKKHWIISKEIKEYLPDSKVVFMGDHVTALPLESFENSKVDIVITGGDYDFSILSIARWLEKKGDLESGIFYRKNGEIKNTGKFTSNNSLNSLPFIDRELTKWWLYAHNNGNFKMTPGAYTMVGRDCWWRNRGGCTFCSWPTLFPAYHVISPDLLVNEIGMLIEKYQVKEVFDDTGTFPVGQWLKKFCELMIERKYYKKITFSCNLRFGVLTQNDYQMMRKAGFRMLLYGVESANQKTIDRLNKGINVENIINECKIAKSEGLEPHITIMVGYPWETREDALRTLNLARILMENGWVSTLQSTVVIPYPGTKLFKESVKNGWLRVDSKDYNRFDMREPVLMTPDMEPEEVMKICDGIYKIFLSPRYVLNHLTKVRSIKDVQYIIRGMKKIVGHRNDFSKN
jgi:radical SAM superfamily enzyme YgiQ (UPF0313 family)|tara:strand:- start:2740 stop:4206 length:1467 start_codon:yes stop_codon:yes gene_type:complete